MSRSPYAVTSALVVACPECPAGIGQPCVKEFYTYGTIEPHIKAMQRSHSARRRLADEQRTREVNSKLLPPLEHDYLPTHEPLPPRVPDLCTDDWQKEPCVCHEQSGPCMHCCRGIVP